MRLSLSDVAFAMVGNLGRIAEAQLGGHDQPKDGNYLYGAFGHDFETREGRRVMVVALTARQWNALLEATGITAGLPQTSSAQPATTSAPRAAVSRAATLSPRCCAPGLRARELAAIRKEFAGTNVSWGPYQTFRQLVNEDPRCSTDNPMFAEVEHPGVGTYLMPGSPLDFSALPRLPVRRAPMLGENTDEVLADVLG